MTMEKIRKKISLVEGLLILVIIGLVGYAGWYSRDYNHRNNNGGISSQESSSNSTDTFLDLSTTHARIPLNAKTSGLRLGQVMPTNYNAKDKSVAIIAPELDSVWTCSADPAEKFKGTVGRVSITEQVKRSGPSEPLVSKKVGKYTYGYETGGSSCTTSAKYKELVDAFKLQFAKLESY